MTDAPIHSPDNHRNESVTAQGPVAQAIIRGETVKGWVTNSIISIDQRVTKVEDRQEAIMRIVFHEDRHDRAASQTH